VLQHCAHGRILGENAFVGILNPLLHSSCHGLKRRENNPPPPPFTRINVNSNDIMFTQVVDDVVGEINAIGSGDVMLWRIKNV
jgi:hypothetical protein